MKFLLVMLIWVLIILKHLNKYKAALVGKTANAVNNTKIVNPL